MSKKSRTLARYNSLKSNSNANDVSHLLPSPDAISPLVSFAYLVMYRAHRRNLTLQALADKINNPAFPHPVLTNANLTACDFEQLSKLTGKSVEELKTLVVIAPDSLEV